MLSYLSILVYTESENIPICECANWHLNYFRHPVITEMCTK